MMVTNRKNWKKLIVGKINSAILSIHRWGKLWLKLTIACGLLANSSFAALELEITQGVDDALPIAVLPFVGDDNHRTDAIATIIANDLKNSGRFRIVSSAIPATDDESIANLAGWKAQGVEAVVRGTVQSSGGKLRVTFTLLDVYNQRQLLEQNYPIHPEQRRKLAHHLSDTIYQQLMGDRGIFSTKIAYVLVNRHGKIGKYRLQIADSDGHNSRTLLTSRFPVMSPTWSPDGKKISYVSFEGHRAAIYVQDIATGKRELLTKFPGINGAPAWSPDGRKMALVLTPTGYPKIYILDLATKKLERLTDGWYLDTEPSWARDGQSLVFTSNRGGSPQIYQIDLASRKIERVTYNGAYNAKATFLPNQNTIVMLHREGGYFTIATQDLHSGSFKVLTPAGFNESPSISPNGKMVVYATNRAGKGMLAEVSLDGRIKLSLPAADGEVQEPAWSPFLN